MRNLPMTMHDECPNGCCTTARCLFDNEQPADRALLRVLSLWGSTVVAEVSVGRAQDWRGEAACAEADPEVFFGHAALAKQLCASCPVIERCAAHIETLPASTIGVWAGLTEGDRRSARAKGQSLVEAALSNRPRVKPMTNRVAKAVVVKAARTLAASPKPVLKPKPVLGPSEYARREARVKAAQQAAKEQKARIAEGLVTREEFAGSLGMTFKDFENFVRDSQVDFPAPIRIIGRPLRGVYTETTLFEWLDTVTDPRRAA